jgi:hypothetical protein
MDKSIRAYEKDKVMRMLAGNRKIQTGCQSIRSAYGVIVGKRSYTSTPC